MQPFNGLQNNLPSLEDGATGGSNGYKVLVQYSRGSDGNYLGFLGGILTVGEWAHVALVFTTSNKQLSIL